MAILVIGNGQAEEALSPNAERLYDLQSVGGGPLPSALYRRFNSMTGEFHANAMANSLGVHRTFISAMPSVVSYSQTAHTTTSQDDAEAYCGGGYSLCSVSNPSRWVMWDVPFQTHEKQKRDDGYLGYNFTTSGFATGITRLLDDKSAIGLAIGYDYRKQDGRDEYHQRDRADAFHAALYGGTQLGCFFLDGYAGYSRAWHRSKRTVNPEPATKWGNYNTTVLSAGLKASYVWVLPNAIRITPSIGLDYSHVWLNGFTESAHGSPVNSTIQMRGSSFDAWQVPIMVSAYRTFTSDFLAFKGYRSLWTPEIKAGYIPQFGKNRATVDAEISGVRARADSADIGKAIGLVGAGLKLKLADKYIFNIEYNYKFASKYTNHTIYAMYGVNF
ncbi:MAG: autotransporter outer membrane beta-barrel domain-containing protein [Planctomycetes bacterium]|nr:autotransporter outer membrane beta-barrel domain-containing protein [Planctomycetota bacterium]